MARPPDDWRARLPHNLRPHLVIPVRVEVHRDDSLAGSWVRRGPAALVQRATAASSPST